MARVRPVHAARYETAGNSHLQMLRPGKQSQSHWCFSRAWERRRSEKPLGSWLLPAPPRSAFGKELLLELGLVAVLGIGSDDAGLAWRPHGFSLRASAAGLDVADALSLLEAGTSISEPKP